MNPAFVGPYDSLPIMSNNEGLSLPTLIVFVTRYYGNTRIRNEFMPWPGEKYAHCLISVPSEPSYHRRIEKPDTDLYKPRLGGNIQNRGTYHEMTIYMDLLILDTARCIFEIDSSQIDMHKFWTTNESILELASLRKEIPEFIRK